MNDINIRRQQIKQNFQSSDTFKILFICSGNIIRSPYAHLLFNHMVKQDKQLRSKIVADSGGVKYRNSSLSHETYCELLTEGLSKEELENFRPKYIPDFPSILEETDLILVMERNHLNRIPQEFRSKSFTLLAFTDGVSQDVPDPYFDPPFDRSYKMIKKSLKKLVELLKNNVRD